MDRKYLARDDLAAALAEAAPGDVLPEPRPCVVKYGGETFDGHVHARMYAVERGGWQGLATWERPVQDGWWHAHATWVPAHRITLLPVP